MARGNRHSRFTIYDMMEAKGIFSDNPANADSVDATEGTSLYQGPVAYPKMLYHPQAEFRIINPGEVVANALYGPQLVGQLSEMIYETVGDAAEEKRLRDLGWHDHPAKALAANGKEAPAMSSQQTIGDLQRQLEVLQGQLAAAQAPASPAVTKRGQPLENTETAGA